MIGKPLFPLLCLGAAAVAACAPDESRLVGEYKTRGASLPATLSLHANGSYEFCAQSCSKGRFSVREFPNRMGEGRIEFIGKPIELYIYHIGGKPFPDMPDEGSIELNYEIGLIFTDISIHPDIAEFVRE